MDFEPIVDRLVRLLEWERVAIVLRDGRRVARLADEKVLLLSALRALDLRGRTDLAPQMRALQSALQHNHALLAHTTQMLGELAQTVPDEEERRGSGLHRAVDAKDIEEQRLRKTA